jgi:hypothetical protein
MMSQAIQADDLRRHIEAIVQVHMLLCNQVLGRRGKRIQQLEFFQGLSVARLNLSYCPLAALTLSGFQ